jgi:hypothetical protein
VTRSGILGRLGRGARRLPVLVWVAFGAVCLVVAVLIGRGGERPAGDPSAGDVVRVGVADGGSIPDYLDRTRAELAMLPTTASDGFALVTLRTYVAPDGLVPVLAGVRSVQVYARVPLAGRQTQIVRIPAYRVPADVTGGMDAVADRKRKEAADYGRLAGQVPDTGQDQLRSVYEVGQQVAAAEADAYREHCSCVYAVVVSAPAAALRLVAGRSGVRAVDPAPEVRRLDRAVFLPPLPEQQLRAGPPEVSAQPSTAGTAPPR